MADTGINFEIWENEKAVALASRTALRVFPFIPQQYIFNGTYHNGWIVGAFRAAALTYLVASRKNVSREITSQLSSASRDVRTSLKQGTVSGAVRATREACSLAAYSQHGSHPARDHLRLSYRASLSATLAMSSVDASNLLEKQFRLDGNKLESDSAQSLMATPIWSDSADWFWLHWEAARDRLIKGNEHWEIWIDWFESAASGKNLHRSIELTNAFPRIQRSEWNALPPFDLNRRLASQITGELPFDALAEFEVPEIPAPRPAAIEPIILNDGRLGLSMSAAETSLPDVSVSAVLQAVKEGFAELAQDAEDANIDRRLIGDLRHFSDRIPTDVPTQLELFRLGHVGHMLDGYAAVVNAEWPDWLAQKYHAINRLFQDALRQFPRWREFQSNASREDLSPDQAAAAYGAAAELVEELKSAEAQIYVEPSLPAAVESLASASGAPIETPDVLEDGNDELVADIVASLENLAKILSNVAVGGYDLIKPIIKGAGKHARDRLGSFGDRLGETGKTEGRKDADAVINGMRKWAKRVLISATGIGTLVLHFPAISSWLSPILNHIRSLVGL